MQNNNSNDYLQEDEVDLNEIFKLLINSKKLIIAITFLITTLAAIYAFQKETEYKSTALIEIGNYGNTALFFESRGLDSSGGVVEYKQQQDEILIESAKKLMQELKIHFVYTQGNNKLSIKSFEDRLIRISHTSTSSVTSKNLLNEIIRYVENRHSTLLSNNTKRIKNHLTHKIESLKDQIEYNNSSLLTQISNEILTLNNKLPTLNLKIKALQSIILEDQDNLKLLESEPDIFIQRAAQSPTLNQVIHSYKNTLLDLETEKINLLQEKVRLKLELKFLENNDLVESIRVRHYDMLGLGEGSEIFQLSQEKVSLEFELELLIQQNPTNTHLIGEIVAKTVNSKKIITIFLSFIFGLVFSIVIVLINNSLKTSKEELV